VTAWARGRLPQGDSEGPGELTLTAGGPHVPDTTATIEVGADGESTAVAPAPPQVVSQGTTAHQWSCSHQATRDLNLLAPGAVAIQVATARTVDALGSSADTTVLPARPSGLWGGAAAAPDGKGRVELGYVDCIGATVRFAGAPLVARLASVYADGSTGPWSEAISLEVPPEPSDDG